MTEHGVLVPTSAGPLGAVITEPPGSARATLVFLQGAGSLMATGSAGRAGPCSFWATMTRAISALGVVTLRADYPGVNESHMAQRAEAAGNLPVLHELAGWFHRRTDGLDHFLAGSCYGAQLACQLAAAQPSVAGLALVIPNLHAAQGPQDARGRGTETARAGAIAREPILAVTNVIRRAPVWAFAGETERPGVLELRDALGPLGDHLEVELAEGLISKSHRALLMHRATLERTVAWFAQTLDRPDLRSDSRAVV